jgi:predicted RNase H-like HicB family nuclease
LHWDWTAHLGRSILEIKMANPKKSRRVGSKGPRFKIETERDTDGRWIAEISDLRGVLAYGKTEAEARAKVSALALRIIADGVKKSKGGASPIRSAEGEKKMRKAEEIMSRYRNTLRALSK